MRLQEKRAMLRDVCEELVSEAGYAITGSGLKRTRDDILIQPNVIYHMGASSSPSPVFVTKVTDKAIRYLDYPYYKQPERGMELWIAKDLISKGVDTFLKSGATRRPGGDKVAKKYKSLMQGKKVKPEKLSDYERVVVTVSPGKGYEQQDLWRHAEQYGGVAGKRIPGKTDGFKWGKDDYSMVYGIETIRKKVPAIKRDKRFKIEKVELDDVY